MCQKLLSLNPISNILQLFEAWLAEFLIVLTQSIDPQPAVHREFLHVDVLSFLNADERLLQFLTKHEDGAVLAVHKDLQFFQGSH